MSTICTDKKWYSQNIVDVDEIRELSSPALEARLNNETVHRPVPHFDILTRFREKAQQLNLQLVNEKGRLKKDGERYMYIADVRNDQQPDYTMSIGFCNNNDKTRAFHGMIGTNVFICSNGVYHGIVVPSRIRHTKGNVESGRVFEKIDTIFSRYSSDKSAVADQIQLMKSTPLTDELIGKLVLKLTRAQQFGNTTILDIVKTCDDPARMVVEEVENPTYNPRSDNSAFRLMNACSYVTTHRIKNPTLQAAASKFFNDTLVKLVNPEARLVGDVIDVEAA